MERSEAAALFDRVVATQPGVERKGATIPYTSLHGHMFSMLTKSNQVALRLPPAERAAFLETYKTTLCEQDGIVQTEYVMVPESLLVKTSELTRHFAVSYAYVAAMKPKPTTKKASGANTPARVRRSRTRR